MLLGWARILGARLHPTTTQRFRLPTTPCISTIATTPRSSLLNTTCWRHAFHTERVFQRANQERRRGIGRVVLGLVPFICIGLGTWQVYRLRWKEDLIARIDARLNDPPAVLPKTTDPLVLDDWEFRKVLLVGQFCHDQEMLIGPRAHEGENGYMVVTPLIREDGSKVLVRRGWIAKSKANPATRPESRTIDIATVYGLVRRGEKGNTFSPANRPGQNEWFVTDIDEMAAHTQSAPIFVDAIYDSHTSPPSKLLLQKGIPLGCSSDMAIRNNHMEYIVTWYALAAATAVMYGALVFQRKQPSQVQQRLKRMNRL